MSKNILLPDDLIDQIIVNFHHHVPIIRKRINEYNEMKNISSRHNLISAIQAYRELMGSTLADILGLLFKNWNNEEMSPESEEIVKCFTNDEIEKEIYRQTRR